MSYRRRRGPFVLARVIATLERAQVIRHGRTHNRYHNIARHADLESERGALGANEHVDAAQIPKDQQVCVCVCVYVHN